MGNGWVARFCGGRSDSTRSWISLSLPPPSPPANFHTALTMGIFVVPFPPRTG